MIERLKGIFTKNSSRRVDFITELQTDRELAPDKYLATLDQHDRENVKKILKFAANLDKLTGVGIAITAVGSTVFPESDRHHPSEDIDLRILNSAKTNTKERLTAIHKIKDEVREYLNENNINFTEDKSTLTTRLNMGTSGGKKTLISYADRYNNDPSFVLKHSSGLPLHLSISGIDNPDMNTYLNKERNYNRRFSLLYQSR